MKHTKFLVELGLKKVVLDDKLIHRYDNTFDQIWTNLKITSAKTVEVDSLSDHKILP